MLKMCIALLLFPNIALALSCAGLSLSQYAMMENVRFVTITVDNSKVALDPINAYVDTKVTQEFISNGLINTPVRIKPDPFGFASLDKFTKGSEWLTVLSKSNGVYAISLCTPVLAIENGFIVGQTGIDILDNSKNNVTLEEFKLAIGAYRQGLSSVDAVCKSANSYCSETKAIYDVESRTLDLPSVQYSQFGVPVYAKVKLQKTSDNPIGFTVTEIKN